MCRDGYLDHASTRLTNDRMQLNIVTYIQRSTRGRAKEAQGARLFVECARPTALETRRRITESARNLFLSKGFAGTTMEAIARAAGVAVPTVYAAYRSKRGLVAELLKQARFGPRYALLVKSAIAETDPEARVRFVARISREVYDGERSEIDLLRGAGVLSPNLSDAQDERNRYVVKKLIDFLSERRRLRHDLDPTAARDILFALTGRDPYRLLVVVRGWSADRYERWLGDTLVAALLQP